MDIPKLPDLPKIPPAPRLPQPRVPEPEPPRIDMSGHFTDIKGLYPEDDHDIIGVEESDVVEAESITDELKQVGDNLRSLQLLSAEDLEKSPGHPDELVTIRVIEDHKHTVGNTTYEYEAGVPKRVPRYVAEVLRDGGKLYVGGSIPLENPTHGKPREDWLMEIPRD